MVLLDLVKILILGVQFFTKQNRRNSKIPLVLGRKLFFCRLQHHLCRCYYQIGLLIYYILSGNVLVYSFTPVPHCIYYLSNLTVQYSVFQHITNLRHIQTPVMFSSQISRCLSNFVLSAKVMQGIFFIGIKLKKYRNCLVM